MEHAKQDLIKLLEGAHFSYLHKLGGQKMWEEIADQLISQNVLPVVLCKNCKFYELKNYVADNTQRMCCTNTKGIWTATHPDNFCSYGERREGE